MASRCNWSLPQISRLWLLVLVWTIIGLASISGAQAIQFSGEIGGNVTFPCPVDKGKTVNLFYIQRGHTFVNGYYRDKEIEIKPWENTRLDRSKTVVHMYSLNISHIGDYQCYVQYTNDNNKLAITEMNLTVTARYSKPTFTTACMEENHSRLCVVTCASHGGYPQTTMRFEVNASHQVWSVVNSSLWKDPDTMMHNSASAARFNCSYGKLEHVRCSVGEATSDLLSVCEPLPPPPTNLAAIAVAVCLVVAAMSVVCVPLWRRHFKHKNRPSGAEGCRANGHAGVELLSDVTVPDAS